MKRDVIIKIWKSHNMNHYKNIYNLIWCLNKCTWSPSLKLKFKQLQILLGPHCLVGCNEKCFQFSNYGHNLRRMKEGVCIHNFSHHSNPPWRRVWVSAFDRQCPNHTLCRPSIYLSILISFAWCCIMLYAVLLLQVLLLMLYYYR